MLGARASGERRACSKYDCRNDEEATSLDEVEGCFRLGLKVAPRRRARWLRLPAAANLTLSWQAQGPREEAGEPLAPIHGWVTEGFDTVDLVEARALLQERQSGAQPARAARPARPDHTG